jgi:predicted alpha/beta superfamily hydrolase
MKLLLNIFALWFFFNTSFAQNVKLADTEIKFIRSQINGINYRLYISFPREYSVSQARYPVLYLLDENYSFAIAHNIFEHLSDRNGLPKAILVGIGYDDNQKTLPGYNSSDPLSGYKINRTRDYTPFQVNEQYGVEYYKYSGGGPQFKEFIKTELIPYINQNYKTNAKKVLVGHSYGGLFAIWTYLTDNQMFDNYIAISPSLWYKNNFIFSLLKSAKINSGSKLYITVGSKETPRMIDGVKNMTKKLKNKAKLKSEILEQEDHATIFPVGLTHGLKFVFD